jgi:glycosyltransferase involved in cell wall biosynthesis
MDKPYTPTLPMLFHRPGGAPGRQGGVAAGETVSIVMRTKDRPLLLPRALRSVAAQSFPDWHLHVVNDGGDAATVESVLAAHADLLAGRATLLHNADCQGMEAASNRALEAARGAYVVVHDDDDTWHPDFLSRTVGFLDDPANAGFVGVVTNSEIIWESIAGAGVTEEGREPLPFFSRNIELRRVLAGNSFPPISLLLRRDVVLQVGGFNADMPVLGDWEFNLRALAIGDFGVVDETLAYYHHRRDGADPVYGNSVVAGTRHHQQYDVLLRNSVIRLALRDNPAMIGLLQPLLHALREQTEATRDLRRSLDERINDLRIRLDRIEEHLGEVRTVALWQRTMLQPVRLVWIGLTPLRRAVARLSGRGRARPSAGGDG